MAQEQNGLSLIRQRVRDTLTGVPQHKTHRIG